MSIGRLSADRVRRRVRGTLGWRAVVFAERFESELEPNGEETIWNLSDPLVMAAALPALFRALGVKSVLATIVAPAQVISVPYDEETGELGEPVELDPRLSQVWWREDRMEKSMPPERHASLAHLFREAGVRRGFGGGIVAEGVDCLRVSELLAHYAFDMCNDVRFLCEQTPLALKACHEADIHVYSEDDGLLASCTRVLGILGLKPYPGGLRPMEPPPPEDR